MTDRVDTEAVREYAKTVKAYDERLLRRLCDELDRTREALRDPEALARRFHEAYERLAPLFGYETRPESAVPWEQVPEQNRLLMIEVARTVARAALAESGNTEPERCEGCGSDDPRVCTVGNPHPIRFDIGMCCSNDFHLPAAPQVAPEPERRDEWRVVDDEGLVCCTEIDDLDDAHATAEMLDRDNPPDRHHVERAVVTWERVPARWSVPYVPEDDWMADEEGT